MGNHKLIMIITDCKKYFLYILYIMGDLENVYKINKYFYMDSNQKILKYKNIVLYLIVKKMHLLIIKLKKILFIVISIN